MERARQDSAIVLCLTIFCIILYFNSLWGIFIFDDSHSIVHNLFIKDGRYIPLFFQGYYTSETEIPFGMFRPLLLLSFSFNYLFSGIQPLGYHIINLLLHFLNGILFFCLLRTLNRSDNLSSLGETNLSRAELPFGLALLISLLFLAHPLNTEAVAYVSSRSDLIVFLFISLGFICYLKKRFFLALCLYPLGLLTKETTLVFPLLISAFIFLFHQDKKTHLCEKNKPVSFYIFLMGISTFYWIGRNILLNSMPKDNFLITTARSIWSNFLTQSAVTVFYLKLFFWPHPLVIHHNFPILASLFQPLAIVSVIAISALIVSIFILRKRHPLISFGLAWYLICLIPKFYARLNIVAAEHHFYLPSFGIYLILAGMTKNTYLKFRRKFIIIATGIISIFTILVWFRNYEYKDEFTFWKKSLEADPTSSISHHNLGLVYAYMGLYPEAEEELKKAQSLAPAYANRVFKYTVENLANIYRLQKRFDKALEGINKNIKSGLYDFGTYQSLGVIYQDMKEDAKAQEAWEKGLALNPEASGILYNLGMFYLNKKEFLKAKEYLQAAIKADPDLYAAHFGLGCVLEEEGQIDSAILAHRRAAYLQPKFVDAHYHLGTLYAKRADPRALNELKATVRLAPNFAEAHNNLAVLYASMQPPQLELAREYARKALSLGYVVNKNFLRIVGLE